MAEVTESELSRRGREIFEKGRHALERGNLPYAMDMFMVVLKIEPRFLNARKYLRATSIKQFNDSGRGQVAHMLSTTSSLPAMISLFRMLKSGKALEALQKTEELLRKDPLNLHFIKFLCEAAEKADMPEVAIMTLSIMRDYYPENTDLLSQLGNFYTSANQLDEARECFETVADLKPQDAKAMKHLKDAMARDSMVRGGWNVAAEGGSYRDVIKDTKEAAILEQESKAGKGEQNLDVLIKEALQQVKSQPDNIIYRRSLIDYLVKANHFDDAIRALEEGRRVSGAGDPQLDRILSDIRVKRFDYEIDQCRANGDMEGIKTKQNEKEEFLFHDTQTQVEHYPNDMQFRFDYGILLFNRDMLNEAIQQFQLSQRSPKHRVHSVYYIGLCLRQKEQFDLAREQLEKAAAELSEMDNLKKNICYDLGETLECMGQFAEAVKYYKEIYQVDISYKDIADKIEKAYQKTAK